MRGISQFSANGERDSWPVMECGVNMAVRKAMDGGHGKFVYSHGCIAWI